jgi:hypothetical protein
MFRNIQLFDDWMFVMPSFCNISIIDSPFKNLSRFKILVQLQANKSLATKCVHHHWCKNNNNSTITWRKKISTRTILLIINTILCALAIAQYYPSTICALQQHIFSSYHNTLTRKKKNDIQRKYYFKMWSLETPWYSHMWNASKVTKHYNSFDKCSWVKTC